MKLPKSVTTVTPFSKTLALLMFILFPLAGFYIGMQYQKALDAYALYSSNFLTSVGTNQATTVKIDMSSIDKIVYAHVGNIISISLPTNFTWGISVAPENILFIAQTGDAATNGPKMVYTASKEGKVTITANGKPKCLPGHLCSMLVIPFTTTLIISR